MSWEVTKCILDGPRSIKGSALSFMSALAEWCGPDGWAIEDRSIDEVAQRARISLRSAQRAVKGMEIKGFLVVRRGNGAGHKSRFRVAMEQINRAGIADREPKKGDNLSSFSAKKGDKLAQKRVTKTTPFQPKKGDNLSQSERAIKGTDLINGLTTDSREDESLRMHPRATAASFSSSAQAVPNRLSKEYFARRGASASAHSPPSAEETMATTIPPEFEITDRMKAWAEGKVAEYGVALNVPLLADKFLNYYRRGRGKATVQPDWVGCWQDWVIRDIEELEQKGKANGKAANGGHVAANHESKRARAVKERFRERTGAELDEVRFSGVGDEAPDYPGWPGPRR